MKTRPTEREGGEREGGERERKMERECDYRTSTPMMQACRLSRHCEKVGGSRRSRGSTLVQNRQKPKKLLFF